VMHPYEGFRR